ncbi:MAG: class I SAM-dependent methyltransferase, partial [Marivivens sp.]|nr:class I SAM-dependent methyltransferase [Marivivens sp.]
MTALADLLKRRIATTGPITLADYMSEALLHPEHGYYTTRDPLGATGDFVTSPEISQMFGEMIGLCLAQAWMDQGRPNGVLAELGPGRGTLMQDILRATKGVAGFHDALALHLVEASPVLRAAQSAR